MGKFETPPGFKDIQGQHIGTIGQDAHYENSSRDAVPTENLPETEKAFFEALDHLANLIGEAYNKEKLKNIITSGNKNAASEVLLIQERTLEIYAMTNGPEQRSASVQLFERLDDLMY